MSNIIMNFTITDEDIENMSKDHIDELVHGELDLIVDYVRDYRGEISDEIRNIIYWAIENYVHRCRAAMIEELKDGQASDDAYERYKQKQIEGG